MYSRNNLTGTNWMPSAGLQLQQANTTAGNLHMPSHFMYTEFGAAQPYRNVAIGMPTSTPDSPDYQTIAWILQPHLHQQRTMLPTQIVGTWPNQRQRIAFYSPPPPHLGDQPLLVHLYVSPDLNNSTAMHCLVLDSINEPKAETTFQRLPVGQGGTSAAHPQAPHTGPRQRGSGYFLGTRQGAESNASHVVRHSSRTHRRQISNPYTPQHPQQGTSTAVSHTPSASSLQAPSYVIGSASSVSPAIAPGSRTAVLPAPALKPGITDFLRRNPTISSYELLNILDPVPPLPPNPTCEQAAEHRKITKSRSRHKPPLDRFDAQLRNKTPSTTLAGLLTNPAVDPFIAFTREKRGFVAAVGSKSIITDLRDQLFNLPARAYMKSVCDSDAAISQHNRKALMTDAGDFDEYLVMLPRPVRFEDLLAKEKGPELIMHQRGMQALPQHINSSKCKSMLTTMRHAAHPHVLEANFEAWRTSDPDMMRKDEDTYRRWKIALSKIVDYMILHGLPDDTFTSRPLSPDDEYGMQNDYRRYTENGCVVNFSHELRDFTGNRPQSVAVTYNVNAPNGQLVQSFSKVFRNQAGETYSRTIR